MISNSNIPASGADKQHHNNGTTENDAAKIMRALNVEEIDVDLYQSIELWHPAGSRGAFGGQMVAQALRAGWNTVSDDFHVHSLHNYFLLPGNADIPVIYQVQRIRDGRSFATRVVTASQKGKTVLTCMCSFTKYADGSNASLCHQDTMPTNIPQPEELTDNIDRLKVLANDPRVPEHYRQRYKNFMDTVTPVEYRDIHNGNSEELLTGYMKPLVNQGQWFKTRERLPDNDPKLHACAIAYASDSGILMSAVRANGMIGRKGIGMMASLDHSMWFHAPTRADEWLYHAFDSPRTNDGRGTSFGRIYNQQGVLVATCSQEGIIRLTKGEQARRQKAADEANASSSSSPSKL
ncbi:acyl-coenzyme a thioesterase 8 [Lichtheimia corymbifera JMRC:FSU:9682]|uniref:Acyl-coenzyme a thioesterase 8 n=1 Tax=Lichtheimia corymbifera JMRC:FSU:9682 TaxID=1263082 RepID=A0A068RFB7_9FUNG|nr:acyl-coenzyme a thioesterase 8 [Lichtheimia corymbifera JMRC:FSU:9682]